MLFCARSSQLSGRGSGRLSEVEAHRSKRPAREKARYSYAHDEDSKGRDNDVLPGL